MDHVLVHSPMGFDVTARAALRNVRRIWARGRPDLIVNLVRVDTRERLDASVAQVRAALRWRTVTPFVPPRFLKARGANGLEGQVLAELRSRGLPPPVNVEVELEGDNYAPIDVFWDLWRMGPDKEMARAGVLSRRWRGFLRERQDPYKRPPLGMTFGLRLTFAEPVRGPIALGYGSHFGLGQHVPG